MSFPKKKFQVTLIIIMFILNLALIPSIIYNSHKESQILLPEPFHSNSDHEDLTIDGDWSNVSTSFGGFLIIRGSGTVSFNNCTFNGTYLKIYENAIVSFTNQCNLTYNDRIEIYDNATVTFQGSTIITNGEITNPASVDTEIGFSGNAKVTFQGCTIETNALNGGCNEINITQSTLTVRPLSEDADPLYKTDLHRFNLKGSSKITFDNSTVSCPWDSILEVWGNANLTIHKNSSLDIDFDLRLFQYSTVTIDNSTIEAGMIIVTQDDNWYKHLDDANASLRIINSTIHSSIMANGINTTVTIQNGSKVDIMTNFTKVEGSLTIFNNTITSGTNYTTKPFTIDGSSTINNTQYVVIGMNESKILIESSHIYGVVAAWNSTINISNSIITDSISTGEYANVTIMNSTVLGKGDASIYGSINGLQATYFRSASSNWDSYSLIPLTDCTIHGKIRPSGYMTIILQNSIYNTSDIACIPYSAFTKEVLVVERESPIDLNISGWIENGTSPVEEITSANLTVNNENGTADPNDSLHFILDPVTHQIPGLADFEIVAYDNATHNFSRSFTIEIPSDAPPKEVFWNTTSEFQNYVETNCTIGIDNLTGGLVNIAYDFTEDDNGDDPADWTTIESSEDDIEVIQEIDGHSKVVKIYCPSGSQNIDNEFANAATGTIEFWLRTSNATQASFVFIRDWVLADSIMFGIYSDYFYYASNAYPEGTPIIMAYNNTWYHIRIQWNCSSGWYVWINRTQYGEYDFYGSPTAMDDIMFYDGDDGGHTFYVDAVDYSWSSGYYTERSYEHYGEKYYANCTWISNI
ncbi:MAG: hypothetical protein HWN66_14695, partial [Candidatus Helarchaeota archaeon]|nr:hypothetical protein [Candidatus Helarchaeota archaeon]